MVLATSSKNNPPTLAYTRVRNSNLTYTGWKIHYNAGQCRVVYTGYGIYNAHFFVQNIEATTIEIEAIVWTTQGFTLTYTMLHMIVQMR